MLENSQHDQIPFQQELAILKLYIDLEKEHAEDTFTYKIAVYERPFNAEFYP